VENRSLIVAHHRVPEPPPGAKDFVAIGFRWRRRMLIVFSLTMLAALPAAFFLRDYESEMKILIKRERADPLVTPDQTRATFWPDLTEEEMNTEVELLRSEDVLRQVVVALGLQHNVRRRIWVPNFLARTDSEEVKTAKAVQALDKGLEIRLPKKSNLITVRYRSEDPQRTAVVLSAVSRSYLEKHLAVGRRPGQFEFFAQEADRYRQELAAAEHQLAVFPRTGGAVAAQAELDIVVKKLGELLLARQQANTSVQEILKRIAALEKQMAATPPRMTTAVRTADNVHLMMQLKTTLLNLELKRTELLKKFQPGYREVEEVEKQIAQAREAVAAAESAPPRDQTTDRDPTYEWMRAELAKAQADWAALQARAASLSGNIAEYEAKARGLNESSLRQQDLLRTAKTLEENYQLYFRKKEEARISNALDRSKILNVSIAQQPTVPVLPRRSPWAMALAGFFAAVLLSIATAFVSEHLDHSVRTAEEVQWYLNLAVLAVLPPSERKRLERSSAYIEGR
jgi:uncharacterized protein involved in exopolysaccharide biosynthesis